VNTKKLISLIIMFIVLFTTNIEICKAQWIQLNGPFGGTVNCLITNGTNLFAGTNGGVFMTTNNGGIWILLGLRNHVVHALAFRGNSLFAGT
jgi:hypothetical protein